MFVLKSLLLGIGLAMDAVAVSMANGLQNPNMKEERKLNIASGFRTDSLLSWLKNAHLRDSKEKKTRRWRNRSFCGCHSPIKKGRKRSGEQGLSEKRGEKRGEAGGVC